MRGDSMAWLYLITAGAFEVVWANALKAADGLTRPGATALAFGSAALSFYLLSLALRELPAGTGYAVFVGIGAVGVAAAGVLVHGEPPSAMRLGSIGLIVLGVVGLRVAEGG